AIEQNHDERGIIWPDALAPFDVMLIPINMDKSETVRTAAEAAYRALGDAGFDVLLDDRPQRPGFKFADADLLGIPHRVVFADKGLADGRCEVKARRSPDVEMIPVEGLVDYLKERRRR
ncbi:MAG: proline--tRNA ligase, partial [Gammaproteobacteria bacterium]|nr:proline--tRNA ligase [Gammaproteobacteria bacterium]